VYLLARLAQAPAGAADPCDERMLYIGAGTHSLWGAWQQFAHAAFRGGTAHRGGALYHAAFGGERRDLYVAALLVPELSTPLRALFIRYMERRLLWEYALARGTAPPCNRGE
jgi:hypothetical protein